jgi:hypothetical protein
MYLLLAAAPSDGLVPARVFVSQDRVGTSYPQHSVYASYSVNYILGANYGVVSQSSLTPAIVMSYALAAFMAIGLGYLILFKVVQAIGQGRTRRIRYSAIMYPRTRRYSVTENGSFIPMVETSELANQYSSEQSQSASRKESKTALIREADLDILADLPGYEATILPGSYENTDLRSGYGDAVLDDFEDRSVQNNSDNKSRSDGGSSSRRRSTVGYLEVFEPSPPQSTSQVPDLYSAQGVSQVSMKEKKDETDEKSSLWSRLNFKFVWDARMPWLSIKLAELMLCLLIVALNIACLYLVNSNGLVVLATNFGYVSVGNALLVVFPAMRNSLLTLTVIRCLTSHQ